MLRIKKTSNGQSTLEYMAVLMFILIAFLVIQKYLARGISGRWKAVGDSIGQGRIYSVNSTECAFDIFDPGKNQWYDVGCFDRNCYDSCYVAAFNRDTCSDCVNTQGCDIPDCQ